MSARWTAAMDAELTRRRKEGQSFGQIAVAMHCPKNAAIGRAKRIGLDPTDWSSSERFYVMQPVKHSPRKQGRPRTTYAEKRMAALEPPAPPPPPKPFRSPIQDEWPLTMCAELPLSLDREYEPVNR